MIATPQSICAARHRNRKELKKADKLVKRGDEAGAERIWRRYLEESDDPLILFNLGVLVKKPDTEQARWDAADLFRKAAAHPLSDARHKADALNNIGIILEKWNYTEKALTAFVHALELNPDHAAALVNLGDCKRCLGHIIEANEVYHRVLATHPDSPEANYVASVMRKHSIILWNDVGMAEYRREGLGQCMGVKNTEIDKEPFKAIEEQVKKLFK